ncbi:MAG: hypothetical protein IJZ56_00980, partial [Oscillospiraceae bacterium]|nr:hypothetical protein [Oscillospiraceae bacterium]
WHSRGQRFDPAYLHHKTPTFAKKSMFFNFWTHFKLKISFRITVMSTKAVNALPCADERTVKIAYPRENQRKENRISQFQGLCWTGSKRQTNLC